MGVRTRMAPSPTGEYHVGHIATLLKNYAFAKKHQGQFVLRIEDTDQERKVPGAVERIMKVIRAFGLDWDEGPDKGGPYQPYTQSQRLEKYQEAVKQLIDSGMAYYCFATKQELDEMRQKAILEKKPPRYDGKYREYPLEEALQRISNGEQYVIRLKVPKNQEVTFVDLLRGKIVVQSNEVDDTVLLKSDGYPTYHLAVVVDDHDMKISHVLRGEEWITSTPKHILLYQAFGWEAPVYAHIPVFLNPDGKGKMSKRKGAVAAQDFLNQGYLPEAMLNFFMILGWSPKNDQEILTLTEYIELFDPSEISSKSVVFDLDKLNWINGVYIRAMSDQDLISKLTPFIPKDYPAYLLEKVLPLVKERLVTLADLEKLTYFFYQDISVSVQDLIKKSTIAQTSLQLDLTLARLKTVSEWSTNAIEIAIRELQSAQEWKKSQYFMMLRITVTGEIATPPLFETMELLGRAKTIARLVQAKSAL
jgi:glutamyl-tRNA synthetase